jgi:hypothetical protein
VIEWEKYEDNQDMLTVSLIKEVQSGDRIARWKLVMIFKSEILRAGNKLARVLKEELGRPNNGPEPEWLEKIEDALVKGYSTNFKLDYWGSQDMYMVKGEKDDE